MPRKPKLEQRKIVVAVNGSAITVTLTPPTGSRRSWYAYWNGLDYSKSTGTADFDEAVGVVGGLLQNGGKRPSAESRLPTDQEFIKVQRVHFHTDNPNKKARRQKSLESCIDSINAFRSIVDRMAEEGVISRLNSITEATPDDCAAFQRFARTLPKNFLVDHPNKREDIDCYSPNTILKWSRSLQAAFERINKNAPKRKCVRGVVDESKLLSGNPWMQFNWIDGTDREIRQFDNDELLSFLNYIENKWKKVSISQLLAKVFLWSSGRRREVAGLKWSSLRLIGTECHFYIIGKWGVPKWFRIPERLYEELLAIRTDSPFVFAAFSDQLRQHHESKERPHLANKVRADFDPENLGNWFYRKIVDWSLTLPNGRAYTHVFRKTTMQHARRGEDINVRVAADVGVSESVMLTNYVSESENELRERSNRTYRRIVASLPPEIAQVYGHDEINVTELEQKIRRAVKKKNWSLVVELSAQLAGHQNGRKKTNGIEGSDL